MPLYYHLKGQEAQYFTMSFNEIEVLLGETLPQTAYTQQAWWANQKKYASQTFAWMEAGYVVDCVNFGSEVTFYKVANVTDNNRSCMYIGDFLRKHFAIEKLVRKDGRAFTIDELTKEGKRIIGNLKTEMACDEGDFLLTQRDTIIEELQRLASESADHRLLFILDKTVFSVLRKKYNQHLKNITLVLLPDEVEHYVIY